MASCPPGTYPEQWDVAALKESVDAIFGLQPPIDDWLEEEEVEQELIIERLQKLSDTDPRDCPACGQAEIKRQLTAPQFRLAGGGWYETDFKKDGDRKRNLAGDSGSGEGRAGDGKAAEGKSGEGKSGESKSGDGKSGDGKPAEKKAEPAKAEAKPAAKPASPAA
ncbi:MAG: hypothetical protein KY442_11225 [Proteobacteria bacterium]|nr:hypothetical protein [Pseudomonadota bacterium]